MNQFGFLILNEDFQVLACNDQLCQLLQISEVQPAHRIIKEIILDNTQFLQILQKLRNGEIYPLYENILLKCPDRSLKQFQASFHKSLQTDGEQKILILFSSPDQDKYENVHLKRSFAYNAISKLSASVAHEIRNPLSSLAIQTEIMDNTLSTLAVESDHKQRLKKIVSILNSELERVIKIIDQFFKLSRPVRAESSYEDLNSILIEVYDLIKQQCYEQNVKIKLELEKNVPFVHVNRDQLIQVLLNLTINCLEAMPEGGTIFLRSGKGEAKSLIWIEDSGQGIAEEIKSGLFQRYVSNRPAGGGVSLALSREIIQGMGGTITCDGSRDTGTLFKIELPKTIKF